MEDEVGIFFGGGHFALGGVEWESAEVVALGVVNTQTDIDIGHALVVDDAIGVGVIGVSGEVTGKLEGLGGEGAGAETVEGVGAQFLFVNIATEDIPAALVEFDAVGLEEDILFGAATELSVVEADTAVVLHRFHDGLEEGVSAGNVLKHDTPLESIAL